MSKITRILFLIALSALICCGCPAKDATEKTIILKAADDHALDYPTTQALAFIKKFLEDKSAGRISVKLYPGAQLGSEKETIEQTQFGAIQFNRVNVNPVSQISKKLGVLALPFLFRDQEHMRKVSDGPIGQELLADLEQYGMIGLCFYDSGARSFYNTKHPINSPADLQGLRVRVQKSEIMIDTIKALGGSPSTMAFEEVYTSLQTGVIDAAENNWPSYYETGHYENARYYSLDEHSRVPDMLVFSKISWDKLSEQDRTLIKQAAKESVVHQRMLWDKFVEQAKEKVQAAGCQINTIADKTAFVDAVLPVYDKYAADPEMQELIRRIRAVE